VQLEGQCLRNGQNLREIRELGVIELPGDGLANELIWVLIENILKIFAG
jgi:hypothetical protein